MREYYKILGISDDSTDQEVELAYKKLKNKYSSERFCEGEVGNLAAKNLTKVENAYSEIMNYRKQFSSQTSSSEMIEKVEELIKQGNLSGAQNLLDEFSERDAEWHYLQSVVFYKKNWYNESRKQLEIACDMDKRNSKYSNALEKLKQNMENNERRFNESRNYGQDANPETNRQMGGTNDCFTFCATWCCMDMLCSICCH